MGTKNFNRQYRLAAGQGGATGFEVGAATPEPLNIEFSIQKSDLETQNTGKISVWNLNNEHLSVLDQSNCIVSLRAGYGSTLPLIFAGTVDYASTSMDGADRKTEIEVVDNLIEIQNTYISMSYQGEVSWKNILDDAAAAMGVAVSYSYNATASEVTNGFSHVGPAKDVLKKGCDCCGLTWSINNGVLRIKKPNDVMSKEVYVLSADSGLIGIPARVKVTDKEDSSKSEKGWDVEFLLNGAIDVDDFVYLSSKTATGYFRVYSIEISGNYSGDWTSKARLLEAK